VVPILHLELSQILIFPPREAVRHIIVKQMQRVIIEYTVAINVRREWEGHLVVDEMAKPRVLHV
jgi:hypothetical protein